MQTITKFLPLTGIMLLSACGGGGSGMDVPTVPDITPQASTGFATADSAGRANVTFTIGGAQAIQVTGDYSQILANGGEFEDADGQDIPFTIDSFERGTQAVSIAFNDDESEATVSFNGTTYTLVREIDPEEPDEIAYVLQSDDAVVALLVNSITDFDIGTDQVFAFVVNELTASGESAAIDVVGFDTDPDVVNALTGTVTYTGNAFLFGTSEPEFSPGPEPENTETGFDGLDGSLTLVADFGANTIAGSATLDNDPFEGEPLIEETITFETANIAGNGFSGAVTSDDDFFGAGGAIDNATYDGNFYGADGNSLGGSIAGQLVTDGADPIEIFGLFGGQVVPE